MKRVELKIKENDIKSLCDLAYERLKEAILLGRFTAGDRLSERKLAEEMGISTSPVKHALNRLRYEGLTEIIPRKGTFVSNFYLSSIEEICMIRASLEGLAARFAAEKITQDEILDLENKLDKMNEYTLKGQVEKSVVANTEFHSSIHRISRNQYICQLIEIIRSFDLSLRKRALTFKEEAMKGYLEHKRIFEAIKNHDGNLAEDAMKEHILRTTSFIINEINEQRRKMGNN